MKTVVCELVPIAVDEILVLRVFLLKLLLHLKRFSGISKHFIVKHLIGDVILFVEDFIRRVHDDDNAILFDNRFVVEPVEDIPQNIADDQHRIDTRINGIRTHIGKSEHQCTKLTRDVYCQLILHRFQRSRVDSIDVACVDLYRFVVCPHTLEDCVT